MARNTEISWADDTVNLWEGCTKISPACDFCYAEERNARYAPKGTEGAPNWGPRAPRRKVLAGWILARKLQREQDEAARAGKPIPRRRVFVNSLSDFFDNHPSIVWRDEAFQLFRECPDVIFMLLTKRPENIKKMLPDDWGAGYENVWIGTTVEDQERANHRVPLLLLVPAKLHFLSMEPLLGEVDLTNISTMMFRGAEVLNALTGELSGMFGDPCSTRLPAIGWVITGGESGGHARVSHPNWFRKVRDACNDNDVPYHHKQNGEYVAGLGQRGMWVYPVNGPERSWAWNRKAIDLGGDWWAIRLGKKRAGWLLDEEEHRAVPEDIRRAA